MSLMGRRNAPVARRAEIGRKVDWMGEGDDATDE